MAQFRPRPQSDLGFGIGEMKLHGVPADAAQRRDAAVRNAVPHGIDNRPFGRRQHIGMTRPSART